MDGQVDSGSIEWVVDTRADLYVVKPAQMEPVLLCRTRVFPCHSLENATCSAPGPIAGQMALERSLTLLGHLLNDLLGLQGHLTLRVLLRLYPRRTERVGLHHVLCCSRCSYQI